MSIFTYLCHSSVELWLFAIRTGMFNDNYLDYGEEKETQAESAIPSH